MLRYGVRLHPKMYRSSVCRHYNVFVHILEQFIKVGLCLTKMYVHSIQKRLQLRYLDIEMLKLQKYASGFLHQFRL